MSDIDADTAHVTNAVKHFKWVPRERGRPVPSRWAPRTLATVHPSSLLRARRRDPSP